MAGLNTTAGSLQIDDYVKTHIETNRGSQWLKHNKNLPPVAESPFGDFPDDYTKPANARRRTTLKKIEAATTTNTNEVERKRTPPTPSIDPENFTKSFSGNGGMTSSLAKGKKHVEEEIAPPTSGAFHKRHIPPTRFRIFYERGDLPIAVMHKANGNAIYWKVKPEKLDYHHYLPLFFDGLREKEEPYRFLAVQGTFDMLEAGSGKILPVIPQLIIPIKTALNTRDEQIITTLLKVIQQLIIPDMVGEALVPYYRQILPILNLFLHKNISTGDGIDYSQRKKQNIGDLIEETLQMLERKGGEDAFINIKYMVPCYESVVLN